MTNPILQSVIEAGLAAETAVTDTPTGNLAFGSDLWCESDLREDMLELDGTDPLAMAQALVRRLDCPRGALPDDPDYGISLRDMLSAGVVQSDLATLEGAIRNELTKDDRVESLTVAVTLIDATSISIRISVRPVDPNTTTFALTIAASSTDLILQEVAR